MAILIPPSPVGSPPGSGFWNDWFEKVRNVINSGSVNVLWTALNFTASNITDIVTRAHNSLQSFQGGTAGEYYHLTNTQYLRATSVISKAGFPTTSDIAASQWAVYKDTSGGTVRLWTNDAGVMKSVTLT